MRFYGRPGHFYRFTKPISFPTLFGARMALGTRLPFIDLGPVVQKWVKFNPGLGEILSYIISSRNTSGLSKILLKYTPRKPDYANPK